MLELLAALDKVSKELLRGTFRAATLLFCGSTDRVTNVGFLFSWEDVGHFASIEDVVDIFKETLFLDTVISEDECSGVTLAANFHEKQLEIFTELSLGINLLDLYLEDFKVSELCG